MIRTRFAPSPTGTPESLHLGFVVRALWSFAYAKKHGGQFVLRIEDTDRERSRLDTEQEIYKVLRKFSINWDEGPDVGGPYGPYRQSERLDKYQKAAHYLVEKGYAYYDFDSAKREKEEIKASYKDSQKRESLKLRPGARDMDINEAKRKIADGQKFVVRAKIPLDAKFEYYDWILKKKIKFLGKEVPDMILLKSDGFPTYHLAVVVDDIDMKISHVFRGQEWISSTPTHLFLYQGFDHKVPEIGHFSVILDPRTGKKFSKRDMSAMFGVGRWLDDGYLPEALLNYLMLLGWAPKDNREIFSLQDFVEAFDQDGVQKANPTFNVTKLDWFNGVYIRNLPDSKLVSLFDDYNGQFAKLDQSKKNEITKLIKDRIKKISDINGFAGFFFQKPDVDISLFGPDYKNHLNFAYKVFESINKESWNLETINGKLNELLINEGFKTGDFFMTLRIAITGNKFTPPINDSIAILGKDETLSRIKSLL